MFQHILLAVDSSDARPHAVATVVDLAQRFGSTVHVLHLAPIAVAAAAVVPLEQEDDARRVVEESVQALLDAGIPADGALMDGLSVPTAISDVAKRLGSELIVLSPHHRGVIATWFSPSVSGAVSHAARVPVLLVPDAH